MPRRSAAATIDGVQAAALAAALGLRPRRPALFQEALKHRSVTGNSVSPFESNERLEFLGDAILGAVIAEELFRRYPDAPEGLLTTRRAALVRTEQLVRWARQIELGEYLVIGQGERISESPRDRILSGGFEALLGAVFFDRGLAAAKEFLHPFLARDLEMIVDQLEDANPKGRLQELTQERYRLAPVYLLESQEGPAHERKFWTAVRVGGVNLGAGEGPSKRVSEEAAARVALQKLIVDPTLVAAAEGDGAAAIVGQ